MRSAMRLGVNIDHIATLREVRKARYPNILDAMFCCERAGADQITVHLREDRRHIQERDVVDLLEHGRLPLNLEMAFKKDLVEKALKWKPYTVTLVPERREEMTTESGLNLEVLKKDQQLLKKLQKAVRVIGFIDPDLKQVELAHELKLDGVEFHTGPFSHAFEKSYRGRSESALNKEITRITKACLEADRLGLEVKAGHGLTLENVSLLLDLPGLTELNIGHSIVSRSVIVGLETAVTEMKHAIFVSDL